MLLAAVNFVILLAFLIYDAITYKEFTLPRIDLFDWPLVKSIFTFASWNIYSTGCILGRNQGLSIVFNKFYGTIINAFFGIALQINSVIQFMSTSLQNAINPQIMMSEGASNRERMLRLSEISSKFSFVLLSALGIPCIFEMDTLLVMWLKEVPPYAVFFCRMWILASIIDQLTIGLVSANQATGHLKVFSLIINTTKLLTLPISIVLLLYGFKIEHVMITFVIIEFLCTFMRIPIMAKTADLSIKKYFNRVILKNILPEIVLIIGCFLICKLINVPYRFFITLFISVLFYGLSVYYIGLCQDEKQVISKFLKGAFNKFYS
jgi:O-antigen/teichoic acid export membrane protein